MLKICPKCGTENPENANFCEECSERIKEVAPVEKKAKESTGKIVAIGIGVCCVGVFLIGLLGAIFMPEALPMLEPAPAQLTPAPEPITLSGTGREATENFHLNSGLVRFEMKHQGDSNFAIILYSTRGEYINLLVNEIGNFDGSTSVNILNSGEYILDVTADGHWEVTITQG